MKLKHKIMLILARIEQKHEDRMFRKNRLKGIIKKMAYLSMGNDCHILVYDTEREAFEAYAVIQKEMLIDCRLPEKSMGKYVLHTFPMTKENKKLWKRELK